MPLTREQGRVIGTLIEKQLTTPQQYPLTVNALVLGCNQSSNREPVVHYNERTVEDTLLSLKDAGLVRFVHPSHGRSVIRYRQVLDEKVGLDDRGLALVGVLLLRGPQTLGELRSRTDRMADFDGVSAVEYELGRLGALPEPLVSRLGRRPAQKEDRWMQLLADEAESAGSSWSVDQTAVPPAPPSPARAPAGSPAAAADDGRWSALADEVAELRSEVQQLRAAFERLQADLGG
jgi:hypothetical protein